MKKVITLILAVCALTLCLVSCGKEAKDFVDDLVPSLKVETVSDENLNVVLDYFDLSFTASDVKAAYFVYDTSDNSEPFVYVIEFLEESAAEEVYSCKSSIMESLKDLYSSFSYDIVIEDSVVLVGVSSVVSAVAN